MLVDKWGLSREALDEYALQTHCRAAAARAGWSQREMTPVGEIRTDQGVRANPDPARLAALPGVFRPNGAITAVNSSQDIRWRGSSAARFRPESRKCCKNG